MFLRVYFWIFPNTQIETGQTTQATVDAFQNGAWAPLPGATVTVGTQTFITDQNGQAQITNQDGYYKVFAGETGYIASKQILLQIGQPTTGSVSLTANVSGQSGQVQGTSTQSSTIAFTVSPGSLDFGDVAAGQSSSKTVNLNNSGSSGLHIESLVSGDDVFTGGLSIHNLAWQAFKFDLTAGQNQPETLTLTVPPNYQRTNGQKSGQIIFWASAN